jgi:hypothetical protein
MKLRQLELDLIDHFKEAAAQEPFARGVSERLARLLAERLRITVSVTMEGKPFSLRLVRDGADVVAKCQSAFLIPREDGKTDRIEYVEDFRYREGQWVIDGPGRLLEFRKV